MNRKSIAIIFIIVLSVCTFLSLILYYSCHRGRNKDVLEQIMEEVEAADLLSRFDWAKDVDRTGCDEKAYYAMGTWITDKDFAKVLLQKEEWLELFKENIGTVNLEKEY